MIDPLAIGVFGGLVFASFVLAGTEAAVGAIDRSDRPLLSPRTLARIDAPGLDTSLILVELATTVSAAGAGIHALAPVVPILVAVVGVALILAVGAKATGQAIGASYKVGWTRLAEPLLVLVYAVTIPVRLPIVRVSAALARAAAPSQPEQQADREAELRDLIEQGTASGSVDARERDIVEAVFEFGETSIGRLMTPRPDMFAVPLDIPWVQLLERCRDEGHARVPVYRGRVDDVIGVLLVKDLLRYQSLAPARPMLADLRSSFVTPLFIPQSKPANATLREFLAKNQHIAFVVDEHGTLVGLLTLDDLLSELVGEFLDYDDELNEHSISIEKPGHFRVKAWMDIRDFHEETGIELPIDGYHTLGGFVFHVLGRLPHRGDAILHGGNRFVVAAMEGRRIAEIQVEPIPEPAAPAEAG